MDKRNFKKPASKQQSRPVRIFLLIVTVLIILYTFFRTGQENNGLTKHKDQDTTYIDIDSSNQQEKANTYKKDEAPDQTINKMHSCTLTAWEGGRVPYSFENSIGPDIRHVVRGAMNVWESVCRIQFVERQTGHYRIQKWNGNYIWSTVGSRSCGTTPGMRVSIRGYRNYSEIKRAMLHELGHCLGLTHEHQRPDRDDYINIRWENIEKYGRYNFIIKQNPLIDISRHYYDYKSIMHYRSLAFSKNKKKTILFNRDEPNKTFSLSNGDIDKIQALYGWKAYEDSPGACIDDYNCVDSIRQFNCFGFNPSFYPNQSCNNVYSQLGKEANDDIERQENDESIDANGTAPQILEVKLLSPTGSIIRNARTGDPVKISYRVFDPDIDITYIHQKIIGPSGKIYHTKIRKLPEQQKEESGYISRMQSPKRTGRWYFITMMEDANGNFSNEISLDFEVGE